MTAAEYLRYYAQALEDFQGDIPEEVKEQLDFLYPTADT